jgi:hypothetical protein
MTSGGRKTAVFSTHVRAHSKPGETVGGTESTKYQLTLQYFEGFDLVSPIVYTIAEFPLGHSYLHGNTGQIVCEGKYKGL